MVKPETIDADLCVVGAGIVGLAHALEARRRGMRVVVLERETLAVGASVRNFGHVFLSAMGDGPALEYALTARERWLELGQRAGLAVSDAGSLLVAHHEDELSVLERLAADERRGASILTGREVGELAPIPTTGILGALHARLDLRVDPRQAVAALARLLEQDSQVQVRWAEHVHRVEPGIVMAAGVSVRAPVIILCPGPEYGVLPPELQPRRQGLTRCRLQMLRVTAPHGRRYRPALLTGLSLLRYPAFTAQAESGRVRARLELERPELVAAGIHLIVTQLSDGDLVLGDTHDYSSALIPFADERLDELVLAEARRLLGVDRLEIRQRWQGVYPTAPGEPFLIETPLTGVRLVEIVSGVGMTTALGLAPAVLDGFEAAQRAA